MVGRVQEALEEIYQVRCDARAEAFVVDREVAAQLGGTARSGEELLVHEADGELELALYLDPELLERISAYGEHHEALFEDELDGFCRITEGVSHFLYLAHTAVQGRTVSLLELEAQAEVDKFALCVLHRWGDSVVSWAQDLSRRLFDRVRYLPELTAPERWRYEEANRLSKNYCQRLLRHISARRLDRFLSELRYSYRLGAEAKLCYLAQR